MLTQAGDVFVLHGEHVIRSRYYSKCRFASTEVVNDPYSAARR
jgi:hypothetical protein